MLPLPDYHARMTDLSDIGSSAFWRVNAPDADPVETREWLEAFDALVESEGRERATYLLRKLIDHARARRVPLPPVLNTPYKNSVALVRMRFARASPSSTSRRACWRPCRPSATKTISRS